MKVRNVIRAGAVVATSAALAGVGGGMGLTASTVQTTHGRASSGTVPQIEQWTPQYSSVSRQTFGPTAGDWVVCNWVQKVSYTQTADCTQNVTTSSTIGGSLNTVPASFIDGVLGFNISWTHSFSQGAGNSVVIAPGGSGPYYAGVEYHPVTITTEGRTCDLQGSCTPWATQTNSVQQYISPTFRYGGTGAE